MSDFTGKSVLITGGASGMGLVTSKAFAAAGALVTIVDIKPDQTAGDALTKSFDHSGNVTFANCDTTKPDLLKKAFEDAASRSKDGTLDIVALFAGVADPYNLVDLVKAVPEGKQPDPAALDVSNIDVNLKGTFYSSYLALHYLSKGTQGSGKKSDKSLILCGSLTGYLDGTPFSSYVATKFGIRGLFRTIRGPAFAELGVRCNLLAPWGIMTPMLEPLFAPMKEAGISEGKGMSFAKLEQVVEAVFQMSTDQSMVGRAIGVLPEGNYDLEDDEAGQWGGLKTDQVLKNRRAAGDVIGIPAQ